MGKGEREFAAKRNNYFKLCKGYLSWKIPIASERGGP